MDSPVFTRLPAKLFLIEHQRLLREALHSILAGDSSIELVGESDNLSLEMLASVAHDVLVMDCDPYGTNVRQVVQSIREARIRSRICLLATYGDPNVVSSVLSAGAEGYVLKDIGPIEFRTALRTIATTGFYVDPRLARGVLAAPTRGERSSSSLTMRELDVVRLIARGLSNRQIAVELHLSEKTIKNHVANVFVKLGFTARSQLAVHAVRHGLTGPPTYRPLEPQLTGTH